MSYKNSLIDSIPLFQRNSSGLEQYIEVSGEVFDEMSDTIDNFKTYYDYALVDESRIDDLSSLFDLKYFSNLNEYGRRKFAKDAAKLYKKLGTEKALKYIFKIIGIVVEVEKLWMLAPLQSSNNAAYLYNGVLKYHEVDVGQYYVSSGDITPIAPLDFIRGDTSIEDSGTYVDLYYGSDNYSGYRIYGEEYNEFEKTDKWYVIKVPYYNLLITEETYNLFVDTTGNPNLDYINQEKLSLAKLLLDYTLQEYIGANEVVVDTKLADLNTDNYDLNNLDDSDYFFNLIPQNSNELRIAPATNISQERFGIPLFIEAFVVSSIVSDEVFEEPLLVYDDVLEVSGFESVTQFGTGIVRNNLLWINNFSDITTNEAFESPSISYLVNGISDIDSQSVFDDPLIVGTNFVYPDYIWGGNNFGALNLFNYNTYVDVGDIASKETFEADNYVHNIGTQITTIVDGVPAITDFELDNYVHNSNSQLLTDNGIASLETMSVDSVLNQVMLNVGEIVTINFELDNYIHNSNSQLLSDNGITSLETFEVDSIVTQI